MVFVSGAKLADAPAWFSSIKPSLAIVGAPGGPIPQGRPKSASFRVGTDMGEVARHTPRSKAHWAQ